MSAGLYTCFKRVGVLVGFFACVCVFLCFLGVGVFTALSVSNRYPHPGCHLELESSQLYVLLY